MWYQQCWQQQEAELHSRQQMVGYNICMQEVNTAALTNVNY